MMDIYLSLSKERETKDCVSISIILGLEDNNSAEMEQTI